MGKGCEGSGFHLLIAAVKVVTYQVEDSHSVCFAGDVADVGLQ